jgi:LacI family transcriptional regulator
VHELLDRFSHRVVHMMVDYYYLTTPPAERIPPLFQAFKIDEEKQAASDVIAWLQHSRPEAVICLDNRMVSWVKEAGFRVPEDIGVVHLAIDDDVLDWTGIHSRRRECAATAVDWLIALMRNRQFGLPTTPLDISVRGTWSPGCTALMPRPK